MAGSVDAFLKLSLAVSLLGAAGSVGYYYAAYLPARDARLDRERQLDRARAEFTARTAADRAQAEREAAEQKAASEKAMAQINYDACISRARAGYDRAWAFACKQLADKAQKGRAGCTADKAFCDSIYSARDPSPECALPGNISSTINADFDGAKDRCLQESRAGLQ